MIKASKQLLSKKSHIFYLSAFLGVLLILGGYLYYTHTAGQLETEKANELKAIAELKIDQLVQWNKERTVDASTVSMSPFIIDAVEDLKQNYKNDKTISNVKKRLSWVQESGGYETIILTTVRGEILLSVGKELSILDKEISAKIIRSVENKKITLTDFYYCPTHKNIHYDLIAPIINDKNQNVATILFRINPNDYLYPLIESWPTPSKTAETILSKQDGDSALYLHELRHKQNTALNFRESLTRKEIPTVQAVLGKTGIFAGKDYRGVDVLAYLTPVPGTAWYMVAKVDRDEIMSDLKSQGIAISLFLFVLISALTVGLMWIYNHRQKNIYKTLWEAQEEFKTTLYSIGDGVITTDKKGRVKHFNQIAEQLTGFTEAFAIGKKLEEVFKIINEGTRNSVENPVQKVLKNGMIIGLANHTLLISNDGREIPIADSGAPIRNENGEIIGVVLVFRDQTEERKSQKIILDSETKYRRLFEAARDGILILDAATGKIVDVNPNLIEMLGYPKSTFIDKTLWEIGFFKDITADRGKFLELQQKEYVRYEGLPLETASGLKIDVEFVSNVYSVDNHKVIQYNIRDITERKHAEKEIIHLNRLYAMLSQSNQAIVRLKNSDELFKDICRVAIDSGEFKLAWVGLFDNESNKIIPYNWHGFEDGFLQKELAGAPDEMRNLMPCIRAYKENHIVVKNDVATDPDCEYWRNAALQRNFKSLAATPILLYNSVIGVFVLYSSETNFFGEKETNLLHEIGIDISFALETYDKEDKRIKAEITLNESESKLRNIFEHSTNLFYSHDTNHVLNYLSPQVKEILGYEAEEALVKWTELVSDNSINEIGFQKTVKAIETGETQEPYELELIHKNGHKVRVEVRETPLVENGKTISIVGSLTDITERVRANEKLMESERKYFDLYENAPDMYLSVEPKNATIIFCNNTLAKVTGYTKEELIGKPLIEMYHPDPYEDYKNNLTVFRETGIITNAVLRVVKKDGTAIDVSLSATAVRDDKGNILHSRSVWRDITKRKQAEDALRDKQKELDKFFTSNLDLLCIANTDGYFVRLNPEWEKVLGHSLNELEGKRFLDLVHPDDLTSTLNTIKDLENNKEIINFVNRYKCKDGLYKWIEWRSTPVGKMIYASARDITERKHAEENIRMLSQAMEQSPASIVITDLEGKIEYVNPKFTQLTGYTPAEALGQNPNILKSGEKPSEEYKQLWETITAGKEWQGEFHNKKKNGDLYWESASISPIKDTSGKITHYLAVKEDITERKSLQSQLLRSQRIESIGTLAGGIAHDLNNVLAPILLAIEYLRKLIKDEIGIRMVDALESSAKRGADIIKQVLTFARGIEGEKSIIQIKHLIHEIENIIKETFPRSIQSNLVLGKDLWTIKGDATNLHQVLLNLCVNARDAMQVGGKLKIAAENFEIDESFAKFHSGSKPGRYVVITVSDTGTGISQEIIDKIFDPFFTTKPIGKGTGLGLSTVHAIVKGHGGFVNVYSQVGVGTTFKVFLPSAELGQSIQTGRKEKEILTGNGELILVIDDEESICEITNQMLEAFGYCVLTAPNGAEALVIYKSRLKDIALVITDMMMPIMDGPQTIRELRKINPSVKIIASSGLVESDEEKDAKDAVDAFIAKPYAAEKLLEVVHSVLHK
jgi:PAS domain S-box-containing protein